MSSDSNWPGPATILSIGGAAALIGGAVALIIVALKFMLPALGVFFGLFVATATTGLAAAGGVSPLIAPFATGGVAAAGVASAVLVLRSVKVNAKEKPYDWTLLIAAAAAATLVSFTQDLVFQSGFARAIFGGIAALWVVVAGALYARSDWQWKLVAIILYVLLPASALIWNYLQQPGSVRAYAIAVSSAEWLELAIFGAIGLLVAVAERLSAGEQPATR